MTRTGSEKKDAMQKSRKTYQELRYEFHMNFLRITNRNFTTV